MLRRRPGRREKSAKCAQREGEEADKDDQAKVNMFGAETAAANRARTKSAGPRTRSSARTHAHDSSKLAMEPPVLSFYGKEPVPLPSRFAHIKRSLVAGHEAELEASWARLLAALEQEVEHIERRAARDDGHWAPFIDFETLVTDDEGVYAMREADREAFARDVKRYGVGVVRGTVPRRDAAKAVADTTRYLEAQKDIKPPPPQDPTCFDFFWTPAQVRMRAHPAVLRAQRAMMGLWDADADDRMATRYPIAYADRIRIHGASVGGVEAAQQAAVALLSDFASSSTVMAQVDNGSLERWEPDGYGRGGTYDAVFRGEWEAYEPWDPTHRVTATPDAYNGHGACSIFRMYQGVLALSTIEAGMIRLLPSPKLATAYFLLRPFFSPRTRPPADPDQCRRGCPAWDNFLAADNWRLDPEQSTIIHGAVPGHAQRLTELWHPHLHLRRTLVAIPTLHPGDYILWHADLAYHITSNSNAMVSRVTTPPPASWTPRDGARGVSILVYVPACPLTQTNALYLARQRKTFQRGHPGPDFDATGSGLGSEASHVGRLGEADIAETGGSAGLQAMGLAPFDVPSAGSSPPVRNAEAQVARLANIILFPDRYDFYMGKRTSPGTATTRIKTEPKIKTEPES